MKKITLLLVLSCMTFYACKKPGSNTNYLVDADLKAAFNYMPGTYWIYYDSVSGETDSLYVRNNKTSNVSSSSGNFNYDLITINMTERNINSMADTISCRFYLAKNSLEFNDIFDYNPFVIYPFVSGHISNSLLGGANDTAIILNVSSNYNASGQIYNNVAQTVHLFRQNNNYYSINDTFYVNDAVGIITMILNHPKDAKQYRVWELQRYKIVK